MSLLTACACVQTRFVNHSCAPNCDMQVWRVMGEPRLVIVTNQAVAANKELTYNYGSSFQKSDDEDTGIRMVCQCGAPNCCGVVGGNANKMVGSAKWCKSALGVLEAIKAHKAMTLKKLRNAIRQCPLKRKKSEVEGKFSDAVTKQMQHLLGQLEEQLKVLSKLRVRLNAFWERQSASLAEAEELLEAARGILNTKKLQDAIKDVNTVAGWSEHHLRSEAEYARQHSNIEWQHEGHKWIGKIVTRKFPNTHANGRSTFRYADGRLVKWAPPDGEDEALWHMVMFDGDEEDLNEQEVKDAIALRAERQDKNPKKRRRRKVEPRVQYHTRFCTQAYTCPHFHEIESLIETAEACKPIACESSALAQELRSRVMKWLEEAAKRPSKRRAQKLLEDLTCIPVNVFADNKFMVTVSELMQKAEWKM